MNQNPPPVIYKYAPVEDYLPRILSGESLRFSSPLDFNDPFECLSQYQIEAGVQGERFVNEVAKDLGLPPGPRAQLILQLRSQLGRALPQSSFPEMDGLLRETGISCFSEVRDSTLMWAHYANNHGGVCVGFDTSRHIFQTALQVLYQDQLPIVYRPSDNNDEILRKSLLTKSLHWGYEREWRIVRRTMTNDEQQRVIHKYGQLSPEKHEVMLDHRGPGLYRFPKEAITELVLGVKMNDADRRKVINWVGEAELKVPIYEALRHSSEFRLEFKAITR